MSISDIRREYMQVSLDEADAPSNPRELFQLWFDQALNAGLVEPNAMVLSTVGVNGRPSSRILLIKEVSEVGFTFFTNYESKKGSELAANPHASLLFYWAELERQVRKGPLANCMRKAIGKLRWPKFYGERPYTEFPFKIGK